MGGKGKWKGKGKGCFPKAVVPNTMAAFMGKVQEMCKGKGRAWWKVGEQACRPCAREGCGFAATWHPTHCCGACVHGNGHGMCCERKAFEQAISRKEATEAPQGLETNEIKIAEAVEIAEDSVFQSEEQDHSIDDGTELSKCDTDDDNDDEDADDIELLKKAAHLSEA